MSRLLDDLLDVSRIKRSTLELKKTPTELTFVVGSAIDTARPVLEAKNHTLSLDLPKHAVRLEADAVRLAQVFSNLLINAAKYTDPGGQIQLRAAREGSEIVFAIRDNGIGISADMMPRLFKIFEQAQGALGRAEGGLGIGLSLVRGIVTLHGGSVEARSDGPGTGSEFIVRLPIGTPLAEIPDIEAAEQSFVSGAGRKILVVDDNRDAADSCAALLELSGHHVQTAYTGRQALKLAETFRPHAILLDIGLPDFDGYQLATTIRAAPWGRGIVLIAITGWGQEEDRRRALEAGCDHHRQNRLKRRRWNLCFYQWIQISQHQVRDLLDRTTAFECGIRNIERHKMLAVWRPRGFGGRRTHPNAPASSVANSVSEVQTVEAPPSRLSAAPFTCEVPGESNHAIASAISAAAGGPAWRQQLRYPAVAFLIVPALNVPSSASPISVPTHPGDTTLARMPSRLPEALKTSSIAALNFARRDNRARLPARFAPKVWSARLLILFVGI